MTTYINYEVYDVMSFHAKYLIATEYTCKTILRAHLH